MNRIRPRQSTALLRTTARRSRPIATPVVLLVLSGCATSVASITPPEKSRTVSTVAALVPPTEPTSSTTSSTTSTTSTTSSTTLPEASTTSTTASTAPSTTSVTTTTTEPDPLADVANRDCVRVTSAASFDGVAEETGAAIAALWIENGFRDDVRAGDLVDVCIDNGIDDITGGQAPRHNDSTVFAATTANVERQQRKLNDLFEPYGTQPLAVDGISGPLTGQRLCAARVALGLAATVDDMQPGSLAQATLFAAAELPTPASTLTETERWALIDRTCQMMFIGAGSALTFIFPTSTGTEGFETRLQDRARMFRYNPAVDNGGWHDSTEFPVGVDNPLNGNLYKPLYFDLGQAIHGANNVPAAPASKGCARLSVANQETLLDWLGLLDSTSETWLKDEINLTVNVQGEFVGR